MNTVTCTCTLRTLARTIKAIADTYCDSSEDPYEDTMSSRVSNKLTKHVIGRIAKKISGKLPSGFVGKDFCCRVCENACGSRHIHGDIAATGNLQGHCTFARGDLQGHALHRNIATVTMPTCDILLRHFSKMMLYTESIRIAYSYLLYTLGEMVQKPLRYVPLLYYICLQVVLHK